MQKIIYLDNNATTAVAPEVFEAMRPFLTDLYGNPSSIHTFGGQVAAYIEKAREQLAALLGAQTSELIFTSCGTESDSSAIYSALSLCPKRRKVVISCMEHPAILALGKELERRGYQVSHIPVDSKGRLDMECAREMIDTETAVVSVMWANNEIGNIYPIRELGELAHSRGALFHTDAVQAVGKVDINLAELPVDMLSLSGHKLHAPKGVGALYVKRGVRFRPFIVGGHQERGRRAGTENVAGIVALGKAAELARTNLAVEQTRVKALRDKLEACLNGAIYAMSVYADLYSLAPVGNYEVVYDFGDILYSHEADKQQWYAYAVQNRIPFWYYLVKFEGFTEEEARALVEEAQPKEEPGFFQEE